MLWSRRYGPLLLLLLGAVGTLLRASPGLGQPAPLPGADSLFFPPPAAARPDWGLPPPPHAEPASAAASSFPVAPERWTRNYQASLTLSPQDYDSLGEYAPWGDWYRAECLARGHYVNDQRIEFTGQEATCGVEGVLAAVLRRECSDWKVGVEAELYLNQAFDRNMLVDTPERRSYAGNFDIDTFQISQLLLSARNGDWVLGIGKMVTPFGRTYFPVYLNDHRDAPFIRTESIRWRETGVLVQYDPSILVFTAALTNGCDDMDTNSSKALVSRIGIDGESFALGASVKWQDGIGSEIQKEYNNHLGLDGMYRFGPWILSGEVIYDQYGFHRPGFSCNDITWYHSLYYRDQNVAMKKPITGVGYYANLGFQAERWSGMLNYGEFYPEEIGDPLHDVTTRRGIAKLVYHFNPMCDVFSVVMLENDLPNAQEGRTRNGQFVLTGFQASF
jgi:hypothetical protein